MLTLTPEIQLSDIDRDIYRGEDVALQMIGSLAVKDGSEIRYEAADPGYKSDFPRDVLTTGLLTGDLEMLETQIDYVAKRMGGVRDPLTGEEPGKVHHELPATTINGRSTAYNACDTTAEFLLSVAAVSAQGHRDVVENFAPYISRGVNYILSHVNRNGLFVEDPKFSGTEESYGRDRKFALKVTDWKDSELNRQNGTEPNYPIVYTLAHFQNAEAFGIPALHGFPLRLPLLRRNLSSNFWGFYGANARDPAHRKRGH